MSHDTWTMSSAEIEEEAIVVSVMTKALIRFPPPQEYDLMAFACWLWCLKTPVAIELHRWQQAIELRGLAHSAWRLAEQIGGGYSLGDDPWAWRPRNAAERARLYTVGNEALDRAWAILDRMKIPGTDAPDAA